MEAIANLNGVRMLLSEAKVSALDRGFLFGDAVYEVIRAYHGFPWLLEQHLERLAHSLKAIRIDGVDLGSLCTRLRETIAAGPFSEAMVYIQITRGVAPRTHALPTRIQPTEFLYVQEFHDRYAEARHTGVAVALQPDLRWQRCDIKSTNLLPNILALESASALGCAEALLVKRDETVTEATHSSFFAVRDGLVLTTPGSAAILPGITRALVIELCRGAGIPVQEEVLNLANIRTASELFLTGTTTEVLPVVTVDGAAVGDGTPGPIARRLQAAYREAVREFVERKAAPLE